MIARFRVLLPFAFSVRQGDNLAPYELDYATYRAKVYPPYQAAVNPADIEATSRVSMRQVLDQLRPAEPQSGTDAIQMDGAPTIQADLLQIDFLKPDFDRREIQNPMPLDSGDPSIQLAFRLANDVLVTMRSIIRGPYIKSVASNMNFWRLDYLTDNAQELAQTPGSLRRRLSATVSFRAAGLDADNWKILQAQPADFSPRVWETLLLDAEALLPEIGASIVLAYSALETFIPWCLDELASRSKISSDLWSWINDRGDWYKEPSVTEQFDVLLRILTTKSLKEESKLWQSLHNLRTARNSFSHSGTPVIGGKKATPELASELVGQAKAIIDWVEDLLPVGLRRPRQKPVTFVFSKKP